MNEREKRALQKMMADNGLNGVVIDLTDQIGGEAKAEPITASQRRQQTVDAAASMFGALNNIVVATQSIVGDFFEEEYKIDEVALLYTSSEEANYDTVGLTMIDTVQVFNYARDHVHTKPLENCYDVSYRFVQNSLYPWRMEIMNVEKGHSPLHESMIAAGEANDHNPGIVHVSFKVQDEEEYDSVMFRMFESGDWILGQSCQSTYGIFSYWKYVGSERDLIDVWIKPRVNVRDAS